MRRFAGMYDQCVDRVLGAWIGCWSRALVPTATRRSRCACGWPAWRCVLLLLLLLYAAATAAGEGDNDGDGRAAVPTALACCSKWKLMDWTG